MRQTKECPGEERYEGKGVDYKNAKLGRDGERTAPSALGDGMKHGDGNPHVRVSRMKSTFVALALAFGVLLLSAECRSAELSGSMHEPELGKLLAAASENVLSESDMAGQKGAGLRPPSIVANEANGGPKVMLWDEVKTSPILNPAQDGVVTGSTVGGR